MVVERHFAAHGHDVQLNVRQTASGWDVQEVLDTTVVHVEHHKDWHRVERAMLRLEREMRDGDNDNARTAHR
jgi:hypothetical protein